MKKIIIFFFCILLTFSFETSFAAKLRVNNANGGAPYTTIADAVTAASAGDTIYVDGTSLNYAGFSTDKRLVFIGPGYFLNQNTLTQANPNPANVGSITFNTGSEGSLIQGMYLRNKMTVNANNIIITRNRFYEGDANCISISNNIINTIITQNYINNAASYNHNSPTIYIGDNATGIILANNMIFNNYSNAPSITMSTGSQAQVLNNVFNRNITLVNSTVHNNIMTGGNVYLTNCSVTNNICNSTQFSATDNIQNVDMNLVFENSFPSTDGKFQLIDDPSNPAKGYGLGGNDCGAFGNTSPYLLSGIPPVPAVYFFWGEPTGSQSGGLPTEIKIKSNN